MFWWAVNSIWDNLFYDWVGKPYSVKDWEKFLASRTFTEVTLVIFWEERKVKAPIVEEYDNIVTRQFREYVWYLTKTLEMEDDRFRERFSFLEHYDIVEQNKVVWVIPKKAEEAKRKHNEIDMLLAKEFIDGKFNIGTYQLEWSERDYPIGADYEIEILWKKVTLFGMYTPALRETSCDPSTWFYRNYSTNIFPAFDQSRQIDLNKRIWQHTLFTCPRWSGKSRAMSRWAVDACMSYHLSKKVSTVWFISYSDEALGECRQHMNEYCWELIRKTNYLFKWKDWQSRLCFYMPHIEWGKQEYKLYGQVMLATAWWSSYLTWQNCRWIFLDEANRISEQVYHETMQQVSSRWSRLVAWSTIYKYSEKNHWFYKKLIEYEIEYANRININTQIETFRKDNNVIELIEKKDIIWLLWLREQLQLDMGNVWVRYQRSDIQVLQSPLKVSLSEEERKTDPVGWHCQNFWCFPSETKVLDYSWLIKGLNNNNWLWIKYKSCTLYFIVRDPAFVFNESAVLIAWYKDWELHILDEKVIKWEPEEHILSIVELEQKIKKQWPMWCIVETIVDWTGIGDLVEHIARKMWYRFTWKVLNNGQSKKVTQDKDNRSVVKVKKEMSVDYLRDSLHERIITFDISLTETFKQLDNFKKKKHASWSVKYTWKSGSKKNDDFVACLMMLNVVCFHVKWLKRDVAERRLDEVKRKNPWSLYLKGLWEEDITRKREQAKIDDSWSKYVKFHKRWYT